MGFYSYYRDTCLQSSHANHASDVIHAVRKSYSHFVLLLIEVMDLIHVQLVVEVSAVFLENHTRHVSYTSPGSHASYLGHVVMF